MSSDFPDVIHLASLISADGFKIVGAASKDKAGYSVSSAGDVNGDGLADIIIGDWGIDGVNGDKNAGGAYVVFGKKDGYSNINLASLTSEQGFSIVQGAIIPGQNMDDRAGYSVSSAGDINGDGFSDIIVGAYNASNAGGNSSAGNAYVIFGDDVGLHSNISLSNLASADGFTIRGSDDDQLGVSVSSAGDVNNDGYSDFIVGARWADLEGISFSGAAHVFLGREQAFSDIDLPNDDNFSYGGFEINAFASGDWAGSSVSSAGDVNGDGYSDVIVGAPQNDNGGSNAGEAYVIFGNDAYDTSVNTSVNLADFTTADDMIGFKIQGDDELDEAGQAVSSAGDINGDGYSDFIVGAPQSDKPGFNSGKAYVIFGKGSNFSNIDLTNFPIADGFTIQGEEDSDSAGVSVSSAGDVNGDGFSDIIIGANAAADSSDQNKGAAYVVFGKANGFSDIDLSDFPNSSNDGFIIRGEADEDETGQSVSSAGDVNGDGISDLIVGAPSHSSTIIGDAYVVYGRKPTTAVTRDGSEAGQTIFGGAFDDTLNGLGGDDILIGDAGGDILDGGTHGSVGDTASYFGSDAGVTVNLSLAPTDVDHASGGHATGDKLYNIENLTGSDHNDALTGDNNDNILRGGVGNDTLNGGAEGPNGDTASYFGSDAAVMVNLSLGTATGGHAAGDTLVDIENLTGSAHSDALTGDDADNILTGGAGSDSLDGGTEGLNGDTASYFSSNTGVTVSLVAGVSGAGGHANGDTLVDIENLIGSIYDDVLIGDGGSNKLTGGDGNDMLTGGAGADHLDGGGGNGDTVLYDTATTSVIVNLGSGTGFWGDAAGDTFVNIENIVGSDYNDTIVGSVADNVLDGGSGRDIILGWAGADVMIGGAGQDSVSYASSPGGVMVNLANSGEDLGAVLGAGFGVGTNAHAQGDQIAFDVENLLGTTYADVFYGNDGANNLTSFAGNDFLYGEGGNDVLVGHLGADTLDGGSGIDNAFYAASNAGVNVSLLTGFGFGGHAQGDTIVMEDAEAGISTVEQLYGTNHDDILAGDNQANTITSNGGNDNLYGNGGNDIFLGGAGADNHFGGSGADTVVYAASAAGVNVNLATGSGSGFGLAAGDSYNSIENVRGSDFADTITDSSANNFFVGQAGADTFAFGSGGVDTILDFTNDVDTLDLSAYGFANNAAALATATDSGANIFFNFGGGDMLTLLGFDNIGDLNNDLII